MDMEKLLGYLSPISAILLNIEAYTWIAAWWYVMYKVLAVVSRCIAL